MLAQGTRREQMPRGLDAAWDAGVGWVQRRIPRQKHFLAMADEVVACEKTCADLTDARLRDAAMEMREKVRLGRHGREDRARGFAIVREVAWRQIGLRPFPVQVAGAMAMEAGCVAEMATGEGKTLAATMPAVFSGWRGRGCHVVTVNDYLAQRDAEWMSKVYSFCGLTVGCLHQELERPGRKAAYQADITYGTNKEITADFLRDRLALGRTDTLPAALMAGMVDGREATAGVVQRGLEYAIVDEADSVLIDEAVTPLIISGPAPSEEQVEAFEQAAGIAAALKRDTHYHVEPRYREVALTEAGRQHIGEMAEPLGGIWCGRRRREELIDQALTVREFYDCGKQYVIDEDKVVIVDEFTGRLMPDREWRDGIHQAVEAKERVPVNPPKDTYARISFQRFFRLYRKLSGMTGTAWEARPELWQIYHLPVVRIPTNRPCIRRQLPDRVFGSQKAKWKAVVEDISRLHAASRPVLVGTRSVEASERVATMLQQRELDVQVLNAVRHREEAQIVAEAGQPGRIMVATNMAGRGTDIKLGRGVADLGGLHVMATERHEAGRIDRQLYGRAGRQGDPGSAQAFVALDDELVRRHATRLSKLVVRLTGAGEGKLRSAAARRLFDAAQRKAERRALAQRKGVLRTDDWLDDYLGFARD